MWLFPIIVLWFLCFLTIDDPSKVWNSSIKRAGLVGLGRSEKLREVNSQLRTLVDTCIPEVCQRKSRNTLDKESCTWTRLRYVHMMHFHHMQKQTCSVYKKKVLFSPNYVLRRLHKHPLTTPTDNNNNNTARVVFAEWLRMRGLLFPLTSRALSHSCKHALARPSAEFWEVQFEPVFSACHRWWLDQARNRHPQWSVFMGSTPPHMACRAR